MPVSVQGKSSAAVGEAASCVATATAPDNASGTAAPPNTATVKPVASSKPAPVV